MTIFNIYRNRETMKIKLISLFINSLSEALKFYTDTIGFIKKIYIPKANLAIVNSSEESDGTGYISFTEE